MNELLEIMVKELVDNPEEVEITEEEEGDKTVIFKLHVSENIYFTIKKFRLLRLEIAVSREAEQNNRYRYTIKSVNRHIN